MITLTESIKSYDLLYKAHKNHIIWGDKPGRLILNIDKYIKSGRVIDAGCGDGKNALFLEQKGFWVYGIDYSSLAISGLQNRFTKAGILSPKGTYVVADVQDVKFTNYFDVVISYGLFHCLPRSNRILTHRKLEDSLKDGGIILFSCLVSGMSLPANHGTYGIELADPDEIEMLFNNYQILSRQDGVIEEDHLPIIGTHTHKAVWIVAKKQ